MKRLTIVLLCLFVAGPCLAGEPAGEDPDPRDVLRRVDEKIKTVSSVRLHSRVEPKGIATRFAAPAEGETVLVGWNGSLPEKFYANVKVTRPDADVPVELTGGGNGDTFFLIDHGSKKGYEDMDPGVLGTSGRTLHAGAMMEFVHDHPFDDELEAETVEWLGVTQVGSEACHEIRVVYEGGQGESIWYFSKSDYLPRRRVRKFSNDSGEGSIEITIDRLEVEPRVDDRLFAMRLPEGYEQIDDFAP